MKGFTIKYKNKTLYVEFLCMKNTNFTIFDEKTGIGEVFYEIDCSDVLKALIFDDVSFVEGTWSESKFKNFIKRLGY